MYMRLFFFSVLFWLAGMLIVLPTEIVIPSAIAVIVFWISYERNRYKTLKRARATARAIVEKHCKALSIKRRHLLIHDRYGLTDVKKWNTEMDYFWSKGVLPLFNKNEASAMNSLLSFDYYAFIESALQNCKDVDFTLLPTFSSSDPIEYEFYCAELLKSVGWNARVTQASNDQGADVIAEKSGLTLLLQCKLYSNAVGNKAVQEASAAQKHEATHFAAVVTNSTYTRAAISLAATNGIALLHHEELQDYADELRKPIPLPSS